MCTAGGSPGQRFNGARPTATGMATANANSPSTPKPNASPAGPPTSGPIRYPTIPTRDQTARR